MQRVLAGNPQVATVPEPWLMLLLSIIRGGAVRADYWHASAEEAISDFVGRLDDGYAAWKEELRAFAERLYARAAGAGAEYFLDKTPRYALIASQLMELFPDGRFVFLWRHPLSVTASCLQTFRAGRFEPYHFGIDLYGGLDSLVAAWQSADDRAHAMRYEDLVSGAGWEGWYDFLGLDWEPRLLERLPDAARARYGDPIGISAYTSVSSDPLGKRTTFVRGPVRRRWCRRYLEWVGAERMAAMGYDLAQALAEVDAAPGRIPSARDGWHLIASRRADRARRAALALPEGPQPLGPEF